MSKSKSIAKRTLICSAFLLGYVLVLRILNMHCPFADVIGIKCPTCGVSRAVISLFKLDFAGSLKYHPLAVPLIVSAWLLINVEFFNHKKVITAISLFVVILNFILYLLNFFI